MLVLFETAAGFALFKVLDEGKLKQPDDLWREFETPNQAKKMYVSCCVKGVFRRWGRGGGRPAVRGKEGGKEEHSEVMDATRGK
jgi:hypothetical protein